MFAHSLLHQCRRGASAAHSAAKAVCGTAARGGKAASCMLHTSTSPAAAANGPGVRTPVQLGTVSGPRSVPENIVRPHYVGGSPPPRMPPLQHHSPDGIAAMRVAGKSAADALDFVGSLVKPGLTTDELDASLHDFVVQSGAYPSPLGYAGFPKSMCASVNEVVCHGIPNDRVLEDGDIVAIDVSVFTGGHHGDTCRTFLCGNVDPATQQLVRVTKAAMNAAIKQCGPGVQYNVIGKTIEDMCDKYNYDSVRSYVGHGIGTVFHTQPGILHYRSPPYGVMEPGTTFTIEPMVCMGSSQSVLLQDNWTVITADGSMSAQFEHTVLITDDGHEVLTAYDGWDDEA